MSSKIILGLFTLVGIFQLAGCADIMGKGIVPSALPEATHRLIVSGDTPQRYMDSISLPGFLYDIEFDYVYRPASESVEGELIVTNARLDLRDDYSMFRLTMRFYDDRGVITGRYQRFFTKWDFFRQIPHHYTWDKTYAVPPGTTHITLSATTAGGTRPQ